MVSISSQSISYWQDDLKFSTVIVTVYRKVAVMFVSSYQLQSRSRVLLEEATIDLRQTCVRLCRLLYRLLVVRTELHKIVCTSAHILSVRD